MALYPPSHPRLEILTKHTDGEFTGGMVLLLGAEANHRESHTTNACDGKFHRKKDPGSQPVVLTHKKKPI